MEHAGFKKHTRGRVCHTRVGVWDRFRYMHGPLAGAGYCGALSALDRWGTPVTQGGASLCPGLAWSAPLGLGNLFGMQGERGFGPNGACARNSSFGILTGIMKLNFTIPSSSEYLLTSSCRSRELEGFVDVVVVNACDAPYPANLRWLCSSRIICICNAMRQFADFLS